MQDNKLDAPVFVSRDALKSLGIDFSNSTLLRLEASDKFPKRVRLSANRVAWLASEITEWIHERASQRDGGDGGA